MDINMTLLGQTIAMIVFVWFCMKFIWPPIMTAIEARQKEIADGLAAAERGQQSLRSCVARFPPSLSPVPKRFCDARSTPKLTKTF